MPGQRGAYLCLVEHTELNWAKKSKNIITNFTCQNLFSEKIKIIKRYHCGIQVKGPHLTLGEITLLLITVVLLQVLWFLPTLTLLDRGMHPWHGYEKQSKI